MANNFRWFDQPAQYSPGGMEDYVAGKNNNMGYQKSQQGLLSLLGASISGGIAPFVGDNQWLERRTKQQMEQQQADMEFQAALIKSSTDRQDKYRSDMLNKLQTIAYMKSAGLDPNAYGLGPSSVDTQSSVNVNQNEPIRPIDQKLPSLADAFPVREEKLITKKGLNTAGKPFFSQTVDPEYQKSLEIRNKQIAETSNIAPNLEKYLQGSKALREAIEGSPDTLPGVGSKLLGKGKNLLADISNSPWYTNYNTAFQQQYLPTLQALGSSKVVSDLETKNLIASLGEMTLPNAAKLKALEKLDEKVRIGAESKFKSFGMDSKKYSELFPESGRFVFGEKTGDGGNKKGSIKSKYGL